MILDGNTIVPTRAAMSRRVIAGAAAALAALALAGPMTGTAAAGQHTVRRGDTLRSIACQHGLYGDNAWRKIYDVNPKLDHPEQLKRGVSLTIPSRAADPKHRALPKGYDEPPRDRTTRRNCVWDRLAECESGGNWAINTGNGYYGGIQFSRSSWNAVGGDGYPHHHVRKEQVVRGERLRDAQGWGAWPVCSRRIGVR
jgi:hypothetical protein